MRETGIVRRIDDLGRVVIPKEIRKTLRIKEGDPLEIYTDKGELLLKKYSPVQSIENFADGVCACLKSVIGKTCYITDTDAVISVSDGKDKEIIGSDLSVELEKALKERKTVFASAEDDGNFIPVYKGESEENIAEYRNQVIAPVICSGDVYGSVIIVDRIGKEKFTRAEIKAAELAAAFISGQFE